jgi:hypothetical protein
LDGKSSHIINVLAQIYVQHTNTLDHAASDGTVAAPMLGPVRPFRVTGQTGSPV